MNRTSCSQPQKARVPVSWSSVGVTSSQARYAAKEGLFANSCQSWRQPDIGECDTVCKRGVEDNCDSSAHEVDFNQPLAVFAGFRANAMEVTWETEALNARSAEAVRKRSGHIRFFVHGEGDG